MSATKAEILTAMKQISSQLHELKNNLMDYDECDIDLLLISTRFYERARSIIKKQFGDVKLDPEPKPEDN